MWCAGGSGSQESGEPRRSQEFIDIIADDPANTVISVDDPSILEITQGSDDGTVVMNPGAKALKAGTAVITVTNADGSTRQIVVVVS